jgi:hypothetical protein
MTDFHTEILSPSWSTPMFHAAGRRVLVAVPSLGWFVASFAVADESEFSLKDQPGQHLDVNFAGQTVVRYMYAYDTERLTDTYKPYLHVMDADGQRPITKGPGGQFPHHRAIFIGHNRMTADGKNYDLWHDES